MDLHVISVHNPRIYIFLVYLRFQMCYFIYNGTPYNILYIDIKSKISHIYNAKRNYILKFLIDLHFVCKFIMYIELTIS